MRIRQGVTSHGFSINLNPDMHVFHTFTTCGLHDVRMVSLADLSTELGIPSPTDPDLRTAVAAALDAV